MCDFHQLPLHYEKESELIRGRGENITLFKPWQVKSVVEAPILDILALKTRPELLGDFGQLGSISKFKGLSI